MLDVKIYLYDTIHPRSNVVRQRRASTHPTRVSLQTAPDAIGQRGG